ncbi:MAG: sulfite exporter TauE/SafE family protein [Candidatus Caldarchaeum sp.]
MLTWTTLLSVSLVSLFAGAFGALLGIGGGLIIVPVLIGVFHIETEVARTASLVAVCVTSMAGSMVYLRRGITDLESASYLQLPTALGAVTGALLGGQLPTPLVQWAFIFVLLFVAVRLWQATTMPKLLVAPESLPNVNPGEPGGMQEEGIERAERRNLWVVASASCAGAGMLSSLLGIGGGLVFVPVLTLLLRRSAHIASATSTYLIGLTASASALLYARDGMIDYNLSLVTAVGIFVGAQTGARLSQYIRGIHLQRAFTLVMIANAILLARKALYG